MRWPRHRQQLGRQGVRAHQCPPGGRPPCIRQLLGGTTWAENPRSRTRRLVTNFRILDQSADSVTATANFAVWRFQHDATDIYVGRYVDVLARRDADLLFRERRVILDLETLRPHGKLSFIL